MRRSLEPEVEYDPLATGIFGHLRDNAARAPCRSIEREFFIDDLIVRIHLIMSQMFLVGRPRAMGV
jgi:hypothetical protein